MARLPIPGSDQGSWGTILNEYLSVSHDPDGTLKGHSHDVSEITGFPAIPAAQVKSDWNATSGVSEIINKPVIPRIVASQNPPANPNVGDMWVDLSA